MWLCSINENPTLQASRQDALLREKEAGHGSCKKQNLRWTIPCMAWNVCDNRSSLWKTKRTYRSWANGRVRLSISSASQIKAGHLQGGSRALPENARILYWTGETVSPFNLWAGTHSSARRGCPTTTDILDSFTKEYRPLSYALRQGKGECRQFIIDGIRIRLRHQQHLNRWNSSQDDDGVVVEADLHIHYYT